MFMKLRILLFFIVSLFIAKAYSQIVINEIQSSNITTLQDDFGEYPDWIELYNESASSVDLNNWSISDDTSNLRKWVFPDMVLPSNSYLVLYASGRDIKTPPLYWDTEIDVADEWKYTIPTNSIADWNATTFDDALWASGPSGFGYSDNDDNTIVDNGTVCIYLRKSFNLDSPEAVLKALLHVDYDDAFVAYLNGTEIVRNNIGTAGQTVAFDEYADINHEAAMWSGGAPEAFDVSDYTSLLQAGENVLAIEVHNVSNTSSDLSIIPFLTFARSVALTDDKTSDVLGLGSQSSHTNFKLSSQGEPLVLCNAAGEIVSSYAEVESRVDISYGNVTGTAAQAYFLTPTPGAENGSGGYAMLSNDMVTFSKNGGFISGSQSLTLTANESGNIRYTTDGSEPNVSSNLYTAALTINSTSTIRARVIVDGYLPGLIYSATFINDSKPNLPVVALTTEDDYLWDYNIGMYEKGPNARGGIPYFGANFWNDWEYPFSFVFIDRQGNSVINQDVGARIFGGWSRANDQKSFAVFARKEYGSKTIDYPFFADNKLTSYSSLVLRNSGNDWGGSMFKDGLITSLTAPLGIDHQSFQPVVTYLNGEYWGIYNLREKVNEDYLAAHYNLNADEITILQNEAEVVEGTNTEYMQIIDYLNSNASLVTSEKYSYMSDRIDVDNFIKYQLSNIYVGNTDWPGNNIKFWKSDVSGSKWRWIMYDTDFGFNSNDVYDNTLEFALYPDGWGWPNPYWSTLMLRRMVTNMEFRNDFINQMADHINTTFQPADVISHIDSMAANIESEMAQHKSRWGQSYDGWKWTVNSFKDFANVRPDVMRDHFQQYFNLSSQQRINLDVSAEAHGVIKVNTVIPVDYPFSGIYFEGVPISLEAIPKAGYKFVKWEGDNNTENRIITLDLIETTSVNAVFEAIDVADFSLVINEINYNSGEDYPSGDWLELYNPTDATLDISGVVLTEMNSDSTFVVPNGTTLKPNEYLVLAKNLDKFTKVYPLVSNVIGEVSFGFSSAGDEIRLYDAVGNVLDAVDYFPYTPWPEQANGLGYTLELKNPELHNGLAENWLTYEQGGTPGKANGGYSSISTPESIAENTVVDVFPTTFNDYVTVQFESDESFLDVMVEVIDMQGKVVHYHSEQTSSGMFSYNWTPEYDLGGGVYFIRLTNNQQVYNSKIIYLK